MAFTSILRKSANSLAPLAYRIGRVERNYHSSIFTALNHGLQSQQPAVNRFYQNTFHFSTSVASKKPSAPEPLIRVLESQIQCAEESLKLVRGAPRRIPFEIKDNPEIQTVTLTREYDGELVKVVVDTVYLDCDADEDDEDDYKSSFPMVVTVLKKDGASLEFNCDAFAHMIQIESLTARNQEDEVVYGGSDLILDEKLQNGLLEYLEMRGINLCTTNFLWKYRINKYKIDYLRWLKFVKTFVEA